jgi:hypothetical protein
MALVSGKTGGRKCTYLQPVAMAMQTHWKRPEAIQFKLGVSVRDRKYRGFDVLHGIKLDHKLFITSSFLKNPV